MVLKGLYVTVLGNLVLNLEDERSTLTESFERLNTTGPYVIQPSYSTLIVPKEFLRSKLNEES